MITVLALVSIVMEPPSCIVPTGGKLVGMGVKFLVAVVNVNVVVTLLLALPAKLVVAPVIKLLKTKLVESTPLVYVELV